jgi:hypothetical protein
VPPAQYARFDPFLTPIACHQEHHRRSLGVALVVMDLPGQWWATLTYAQTLANWQYSSLSVGPYWAFSHEMRNEIA